MQINDEALYNVVVWLADSSSNEVAWANSQGTLSAGTHTANLHFDGIVIRKSGVNVPYKITRSELKVGDEEVLEVGNLGIRRFQF